MRDRVMAANQQDRTGLMLASYLVYASASKETEVWMAVVHVDAACGANESHGTFAGKVVEEVSALAPVEAGGGGTLVHLRVAVGTGVPGETLAVVAVDPVLTPVGGEVVAGGGATVVNIHLTLGASEPLGAHTRDSIDLILDRNNKKKEY